MGIQLNPASQPEQAPPDHREPDFYIDSNCCTLHDAVQQLAIDGQADTPFTIWLLEHPSSPIAAIPYLESASGIFEGRRSGFVAIVIAMFFVSAWFASLFAAILTFATAPVLLMIEVLMMSGVRAID